MAPAPRKRSTTEAGLGWQHQRQRVHLMQMHTDGAPCPCLTDQSCGPGCLCRRAGYALPMYRNATQNADGMALEADHSVARSQGGRVADRLMLATCNRSRGDGTRASRMQRALWWTRDWTATSPP